jgi:hypothetical protein
MIETNEILGSWMSGPGGHNDDYLTFLSDGTGEFEFVSLTQSSRCKFGWRLYDSRDRISFTPLGPPSSDCHLFEQESWIVTLESSDEIIPRDVLVMKCWKEATKLSVGDFSLDFPAGWIKHALLRSGPSKGVPS